MKIETVQYHKFSVEVTLHENEITFLKEVKTAMGPAAAARVLRMKIDIPFKDAWDFVTSL